LDNTYAYKIPAGGSIVIEFSAGTIVRNTDYCWVFGKLTGNIKCEMDPVNKKAIITGFDEYTT